MRPLVMTQNPGVGNMGRLTGQSAIAMAGGVLSQGCKLLVYLYIARSFSSSDFGSIAFANAINSFVFIVSQFGLPVLGSRTVARTGRAEPKLLFVVACCRAALALLGTFGALCFLALTPGATARDYALVAFFGLSNVPLAGLFDWVFQGLNRQAASAVLNVIWQLCWLAFTYLGMNFWKSVQVVPLALCLSGLVATLVGLVWLRLGRVVEAGDTQRADDWMRIWQTLRNGGALGTGTILLNVLVWTDSIVVRLMLGNQAVGWYAAGNRAAMAVSMLSNFYMQAAFPLLCNYGESLSSFQTRFQRVYDDLMLLFLPGSIWGIFYAPAVILFLFKRQEYLAAVPVFRIFQVVLPLIVINLLYGMGALLARHEDHAYRQALTAAVGVLIVLCPSLTYLYGIQGTAWAVLAAYLASIGLFQFRSRQFVRPNHLEALLAPSLCGVAAVIAGKLLHAGLFLAITLLVLAYSILLFKDRGRLLEDFAI